MPDNADPKESKDYKELIEQFNRYIEYGKQEKLIPETIDSTEEFIKCNNFMKVISRYSMEYDRKVREVSPDWLKMFSKVKGKRKGNNYVRRERNRKTHSGDE